MVDKFATLFPDASQIAERRRTSLRYSVALPRNLHVVFALTRTENRTQSD